MCGCVGVYVWCCVGVLGLWVCEGVRVCGCDGVWVSLGVRVSDCEGMRV